MTYKHATYSLFWRGFHSHYTKVDFAVKQDLSTDMTDAAPKPPRRMRMTQFYSKRYYDSRIKSVFESEWASILASDAESKPSRINVLNAVTSRLWDSESASFKSWLQGQRDLAYARELQEHQTVVKEMESAPDSAESYHA